MLENHSFLRSLRFGLLLAVVFAATHVFRLTHHGVWIDELHTYGSILMPWSELADERFRSGHIPTYFWLMKAWCGFAGANEWTMRLPSVLFATLAFFAFFLLTRRFLPARPVYLIALALFFFHPFLLWASRDARMYALVCFACVLAAHQLLSFVESEEKKYLWGYAAAAVIGLGVHVIFSLQIAAHVAFLAAHHRRLLGRFMPAAAPGLVVFLPVIFFTISRAGGFTPGIRWKFPDLFLIVRKASVVTSTDFAQYLPWEGGVIKTLCRNVSPLFFLIFLVLAWRRYRAARRAPTGRPTPAPKSGQNLLTLFAFYWIGAPALILAVSLIFDKGNASATRYHIPALGAFIVLAAIELGDRRVPPWRHGLKWTYAAFFLFGLISQLSWTGPGIREAVLFAREEAGPSDGVVYCHGGALAYAFSFYGCDHLDLLPIDRAEKKESLLRDRIVGFSSDRKKLRLVLHNTKQSPLPDLLDTHSSDLFECIEDMEFGITRVKVYRVQARTE